MSARTLEKADKAALKRLIEYSASDERSSLEEWICDNFGGFNEPTNEDTMTDEELYAFCVENKIVHIWMDIHILSKFI